MITVSECNRRIERAIIAVYNPLFITDACWCDREGDMTDEQADEEIEAALNVVARYAQPRRVARMIGG